MAERIDHAAEACEALRGAGDGRNFATDASVVAVAHAVLALVEQTRIANLFALDKSWRGEPGDALMRTIRDEGGWIIGHELNPEIAAALGIEQEKNDD